MTRDELIEVMARAANPSAFVEREGPSARAEASREMSRAVAKHMAGLMLDALLAAVPWTVLAAEADYPHTVSGPLRTRAEAEGIAQGSTVFRFLAAAVVEVTG